MLPRDMEHLEDMVRPKDMMRPLRPVGMVRPLRPVGMVRPLRPVGMVRPLQPVGMVRLLLPGVMGLLPLLGDTVTKTYNVRVKNEEKSHRGGRHERYKEGLYHVHEGM
jgi:hypothetical protein